MGADIRILLYLLLFSNLAYSQITSPEQFLGHKPGADYKLTTYEQWTEYLGILDSQSPRIMIGDMGETTEGRRMLYGIISSEENLRNISEIKEIAKKLSLVEGLSETDAQEYAVGGRAIVWISAGLHSTEVAPPQHHFQLPYDMITSEDEQIRMIRDSVILILPIVNPDGMTLVAEWYRKNLGTDFEVSPLPVLYNKYAGHDNNRDTFIANLRETQNINRAINEEWFLSLFYDQHQSAPFPARIWIPPGPEPTNPNKHPIIIRTKNMVGSAMGKGLDENDQPGAISRIAFDIWYPGYIDGPAIEGHNIASILTETALYKYATPKTYTIDDFPEEYKELRMGVFYPSPWKGGEWHIGDAVQYNLTASKSLLEVVAKYKSDFLFNKYKMGTDVISRFSKEGPFGWIVPKDQADKSTMALMINRMMGNGVQVYTADGDIAWGDQQIKKGDYVIPTDQPFGLYVKNIMENQDYPDLRKYPHLWQGISRMVKWDGAPFLPYDGVGWTLPKQMGVRTQELAKPAPGQMELLTEPVPTAKVSGTGTTMIFSAADNNSYRAVNMLLKRRVRVSRTVESIVANGKELPPGSFIASSNGIDPTMLANEADTEIILSSSKNAVKKIQAKRIGLYDSWMANMDAGWIKLLLEQYGFDYTVLRDEDIRKGNLKNTYDVIIIPDQSMKQLLEGHAEGNMPPEYVGGLGEDGMNALMEFVKSGGNMILNKRASQIALDYFDLPIANVLADTDFSEFTCPGSILKVRYDNAKETAYGMPIDGIGYFAQGQAYEVSDDQAIEIIASFPNDSLLVSGWLEGGELIQGKAAILKAKIEQGSLYLFGFNVQNRMQAYATIKLMMNALLND